MVARGWRMWNIRSMNFSHKYVHKSMYVLCHLHKYINLCVCCVCERKHSKPDFNIQSKTLILLSSFSIEARTLTDLLHIAVAALAAAVDCVLLSFFFPLKRYNSSAFCSIFWWSRIKGVDESVANIPMVYICDSRNGCMCECVCVCSFVLHSQNWNERDKFVFQLKSLMHWLNDSHCKWMRTQIVSKHSMKLVCFNGTVFFSSLPHLSLSLSHSLRRTFCACCVLLISLTHKSLMTTHISNGIPTALLSVVEPCVVCAL